MNNYSLHKLVRRSFFIMSIIPIICFGLYIYISQSQYNQSLMQQLIHDNFNTYRTHLDSIDEENTAMLDIIAEDLAYQDSLDNENILPYLKSHLHTYKNLFKGNGSVIIALEDGSYLSDDSRPLPKDFNPLIRPWYTGSIQNPNQVTISKPYIDATDNETYTITYSKPLINPKTGNLLGVIGIDIKLNTILNFESYASFPKGTYFALAEPNGHIIVDSKNPIQNAQKQVFSLYKATQINPKAQNNEISQYIQTINNVQYDVFIQTHPSTSWVMIALIPKTELIKKQYNILWYALIITGFLFLLSFLCGKRFNHYLVRPIDHMVGSLEQINLDQSLSTLEPYKDEPLELSAVRSALNQLFNRINQHKTHLNQSYKETIRSLTNAIEANDHYTRGHCDRVTELSVALGRSIGLDESRIKHIELAAHLHDVGKVGIPFHILNKTERLTDEEFAIIKAHPVTGYHIIKDVSFLSEAAPIVKQHHERIDGNGYPSGLKGDDILLEARIIAIADSFDAMTSSRSYRKIPLSEEQAFVELMKNSGAQFDSKLAQSFIEMMRSHPVLPNKQVENHVSAC